MRKIKLILISLLILVLIFGLSQFSYSDRGKLIGRLKLDRSDPVLRVDDHLVPLEDVAEKIDYPYDWELDGREIRGFLGDLTFKTSEYMIYKDKLYVNRKIFTSEFGLEAEVRGNNYYFYRYTSKQDTDELKLKVKTNKVTINRDEPLAVSLLLPNNTEESINLNFRSGKKYDLVLSRFGEEVWRFSDDRGYSQNIERRKLEDREFLHFVEIINPEGLRPGRYNLVGEINTSDEVIKSEPLIINFR